MFGTTLSRMDRGGRNTRILGAITAWTYIRPLLKEPLNSGCLMARLMQGKSERTSYFVWQSAIKLLFKSEQAAAEP